MFTPVYRGLSEFIFRKYSTELILKSAFYQCMEKGQNVIVIKEMDYKSIFQKLFYETILIIP